MIVTKINRMESIGMLKNLEIGSTISPKELSSAKIVQYVRAVENRSGAAITIHNIADGQVETMEFIADDKTLYLNTPLKDIPLKNGILVSCIAHGANTEIPNGDSTFHSGDSVIIVTERESPILSLNDIFK